MKGKIYMNKQTWIKVYLDEETTNNVCLLGGGDSHDYLSEGITTAINFAVASMLHSPIGLTVDGSQKLG